MVDKQSSRVDELEGKIDKISQLVYTGVGISIALSVAIPIITRFLGK